MSKLQSLNLILSDHSIKASYHISQHHRLYKRVWWSCSSFINHRQVGGRDPWKNAGLSFQVMMVGVAFCMGFNYWRSFKSLVLIIAVSWLTVQWVLKRETCLRRRVGLGGRRGGERSSSTSLERSSRFMQTEYVTRTDILLKSIPVFLRWPNLAWTSTSTQSSSRQSTARLTKNLSPAWACLRHRFYISPTTISCMKKRKRSQGSFYFSHFSPARSYLLHDRENSLVLPEI